MTHYFFRRFWQSLLVLFGVSLIVFILLHLSGDPAILMMPPDATKEDIENFRKLMGFNDPLFISWPPWRIPADLGLSISCVGRRSHLPVVRLRGTG